MIAADRDLLKLAARAAGYQLHQYHEDVETDPYDLEWRITCTADEYGAPCAPWHKRWNPLTDDGDALRLAHAVGLNLKFDGWFSISHHRLHHALNCTGRLPLAEVRRLIVQFAVDVALLPPEPEPKPIKMSELAAKLLGKAMP